ncbi:FAD-binding oxidoreductase [Wenzhouxiangella sp. AB-CW3]|uniref:NAD(P)/FAD-dependent oxidoreductase n=1 Tax=Wenzhouxiangella sp. AB-CW3 TaxID=2771012 RepID=UPI00168AC653|nr:FAD-dependent oxidoreductase [Wenzhouxiangella sp. AB-CW3]QOC21970.1 FAD-binding oxidoreductase [Wenzhouxiangella sp. AB-CW3]
MARFDLVVVGAGIVGAACAEAAAGEGLRVAVVESETIGGGTTSAAMGHVVALDGTPEELAFAAWSQQLWQRFAASSGIELNRCGTLWLAPDDAALAELSKQKQRMAQAGVNADMVNQTMLYRLEPELAPGLVGALRVSGDMVIYPPAAARLLMDVACCNGAELFSGRRVLEVLSGGVRLDDGEELTGQVLLACGLALPEFLPELPLYPRKGYLAITDRHPRLIKHQLIEAGYVDSAKSTEEDSVAFNVQPRPGGQILIGSTRETGNTDASIDPEMLARMLRRATGFLPALRPMQVIRVWSGFRPTTADGRPYLGAVPGRDDVWVAAGHEGLGVTLALGSARVLIDQVLGRAPTLALDCFSPERVVRGAAA